MKKIVFTAKDGMCPKYDAFGKRYYIQDRFFGGNYEYALMSRGLTTGEVLRFPDNRMLAAWLNGRKERILDGLDDVTANYVIRRDMLQEYNDMSLIEKDGKKYILKKAGKEFLLNEYREPIQETGWFPGYRECLNMAKKILSDMENKINGEQMTLQL